MSNANPASHAMSAAGLSVAPLKRARRLASRAVEAIVSAVLRRAVRRTHHELAALDDRMLADIGLDRASVDALAAISRREAWVSLAQFAWHRRSASA